MLSIDETQSPKFSHDHALTFPEKLMIILLDKKNEKAIRWNHKGTRFSIKNRHLLCTEVLPCYFQTMKSFKYGSFARKLSRWQFIRTSSGLDTRIYSNPLFRRDKPELCSKMTCKSKIETIESEKKTNTVSGHLRSSADTSVPTPDDKHEPENSHSCSYNRSNLNRLGKSCILEKLRHEASILYDYPIDSVPFQAHSDVSLRKTTSVAATQAVVDAAIIAMNRCDEAVTKTAKAQDLNIKIGMLIYERQLRIALEARLGLEMSRLRLGSSLYKTKSITKARPDLAVSKPELESSRYDEQNSPASRLNMKYIIPKNNSTVSRKSATILLPKKKRLAETCGENLYQSLDMVRQRRRLV